MVKIAFAIDDEKTIHKHFGRASYYIVVALESGKIAHVETRQKPSYAHHSHGHKTANDIVHGLDNEARTLHDQMAGVIADCEALICGGMGIGAYKIMEERGIRPIITDINTVEEAALAFTEKKIINHVEKLH